MTVDVRTEVIPAIVCRTVEVALRVDHQGRLRPVAVVRRRGLSTQRKQGCESRTRRIFPDGTEAIIKNSLISDRIKRRPTLCGRSIHIAQAVEDDTCSRVLAIETIEIHYSDWPTIILCVGGDAMECCDPQNQEENAV